ncbi:hypothetical protein ANO14919_104510 [Xylariales sp. No.14919]|nr:hypothetical protein ANO14919_104510 [Xylariales sp. No.14919]
MFSDLLSLTCICIFIVVAVLTSRCDIADAVAKVSFNPGTVS